MKKKKKILKRPKKKRKTEVWMFHPGWKVWKKDGQLKENTINLKSAAGFLNGLCDMRIEETKLAWDGNKIDKNLTRVL